MVRESFWRDSKLLMMVVDSKMIIVFSNMMIAALNKVVSVVVLKGCKCLASLLHCYLDASHSL